MGPVTGFGKFATQLVSLVSVEAAGIHSIVFGVELIAVVLVTSIGTATLTLSGFETGKKNIGGVWDVVLTSAILSWAICAFNLAVFMLIPVLYFFETRREPSKMNYVYTVMLALSMVLMVGFSVSFLPFQEQTIVSGIKTAILWALLFLVFVEGCIDLNRKRKAGTVSE